MGSYLHEINKEQKKESSKIKYFFRFLFKTLFYTVISLFIIILLVFLVCFVDKKYNEKKHTGKRPILNAYVIVSPSMIPTIKINDAVVVLRYKASNLKVGNIITFSSTDPSFSGLTVTHRIVAKNKVKGKYVFTTKGDHNNAEDPALVQEDNIYGKVIFKIPKLGYIRNFLTTTYGFLIFIFLPALCIIIYDIIKLLRKIKLYFQLKAGNNIDEDDESIIEKNDNIVEEMASSESDNSDIEVL